jgi:hypothetical protein
MCMCTQLIHAAVALHAANKCCAAALLVAHVTLQAAYMPLAHKRLRVVGTHAKTPLAKKLREPQVDCRDG